MNQQYVPPQFGLPAFNCPLCGAFAHQGWYFSIMAEGGLSGVRQIGPIYYNKNMKTSLCSNCNKYSVWVEGKMIYPFSGTAPLPNADLPDNVIQDYMEARNISTSSPRGAAALLRLAIQKLCVHLGEKGDNLNDDIGSLVKKGLPLTLQKALDSVRVIGNNAVHPGQIDLKDDIETVNQLFVFVNVICENQISIPKTIGEFYKEKIPEQVKTAIENRDKT